MYTKLLTTLQLNCKLLHHVKLLQNIVKRVLIIYDLYTFSEFLIGI